MENQISDQHQPWTELVPHIVDSIEHLQRMADMTVQELCISL